MLFRPLPRQFYVRQCLIYPTPIDVNLIFVFNLAWQIRMYKCLVSLVHICHLISWKGPVLFICFWITHKTRVMLLSKTYSVIEVHVPEKVKGMIFQSHIPKHHTLSSCLTCYMLNWVYNTLCARETFIAYIEEIIIINRESNVMDQLYNVFLKTLQIWR